MYKLYSGTLVGFKRGEVHVEGIITLQMTLSNHMCTKAMEVNFLIVSAHNDAHNVILRRLSLKKIGAIISTPHLLMNFPTS